MNALKLNWNQLSVQSRKEICWGATISQKLSKKPWGELEPWIQILLTDSIERRSKKKVTLVEEAAPAQ
jgi:hypothetical protein